MAKHKFNETIDTFAWSRTLVVNPINPIGQSRTLQKATTIGICFRGFARAVCSPSLFFIRYPITDVELAPGLYRFVPCQMVFQTPNCQLLCSRVERRKILHPKTIYSGFQAMKPANKAKKQCCAPWKAILLDSPLVGELLQK